MEEVKRIQARVEAAINNLELSHQPAALYDPISYTMSLGGKRMRPVLLLLATKMAGGNAEDALQPAVGVELFHNFTLLHDDIMDAAPLRRGKPTVYQKYDTNTAILSGDVMMVMAHQLVMQVDKDVMKPVLEVFNKTAIEVCEGQQYDLVFEDQPSVSIEEYLEMIRLKTAVLLGGSMTMGALIAGQTMDEASRLGTVGEQLGLAFQMQDDILDTFGDPNKFGKQVGGDIIQNKRTYLLLKAFENANEKDKRELNDWLGKKEFDKADKVRAIAAIYKRTGAYEDALRLRDNYYNRAINELETMQLHAEPKAAFLQLAQQLLNRET